MALLLSLLYAPIAVAQQPEAAAEAPLPTDPIAALHAMTVSPGLETGYPVQVRDENGQPVPDAVLVWLPFDTSDYRKRINRSQQRYPGDQPQQLAARALLGTRLALDEEGATRVPRKKNGLLLAVHEGRFAVATHTERTRKTTRKATLTVRRPVTAHVRVLQADGQPAAAVPVGVSNGTQRGTTLRRPTKKDGTASIRILANRGGDIRYVCADATTREPVHAPFPEDGKENSTLELQLPPCGSIEATYTARSLPGSTHSYRLRIDDDKTSWKPTHQEATRATFAWVEAGLTGNVTRTADQQRINKEFGPIIAQLTTKVELPPADGKHVVMRLLKPDGEPIRGGYARTTWHYGNGTSSSGVAITQEGWLMVSIPGRYDKNSTLTLKAMQGGYTGRLLGSITPALGKPVGNYIELGELRIDAPEFAARGRIATPDGKPVAKLRLRTSDGGVCETDDDGRFELFRAKDDPPISKLELSSDNYYMPTAPYTELALDGSGEPVEIVVKRAARILLHAEDVPKRRLLSQIQVQCVPVDDEDAAPLVIRFDISSKLLRMPAGHWDVVFTHYNEEIHRIEGLTADPGIETHDPRFMFFDWKQFLAFVTVTVQDENGKPDDECTIWLRSARSSTGTSPSDGKLSCLVPKQGGHIGIDRNNGTKINLGIVNTDQIVRFGAGPRLLIRLAKPPSLPAGLTLIAKVGAIEQALDADGQAELWLPHADSVRATLSVASGERRSTLALPRLASEIDVLTGGASLQIPVDAAFGKALQTALESLR